MGCILPLFASLVGGLDRGALVNRRPISLSRYWVAAALACVVLTGGALDASAQPRLPGGLSGASPLGASGPSLGSPPLGPNVLPGGPGSQVTDDVRQSLPQLNVPVDPAKKPTDTVTNTLGGAAATVPAP